ncbi:hypothetical protein BDI4_100059 [Burkholderia diffusa]|nr:hypothetical protein BDI4_100059 [Burkholderia diffusa]
MIGTAANRVFIFIFCLIFMLPHKIAWIVIVGLRNDRQPFLRNPWRINFYFELLALCDFYVNNDARYNDFSIKSKDVIVVIHIFLVLIYTPYVSIEAIDHHNPSCTITVAPTNNIKHPK